MLLGPSILEPERLAEALMPFAAVAAPFLVFAVALTAFVLVWRSSLKKLAQLKAMDYQWYAKTYPTCVEGERVKCRSCGSAHSRTERLMGRTFLRRHFCGRCGTTLYYSPEN